MNKWVCVICVSLLLSGPVLYGQQDPSKQKQSPGTRSSTSDLTKRGVSPFKAEPTRFNRKGRSYTIQSFLEKNRVGVEIQLDSSRSTSERTSLRQTEQLVMALESRGFSVTSRTAGRVETMTVTTEGDPNRLRGTYTRGGSTSRTTGTGRDVIDFMQRQSDPTGTAYGSRNNTSLGGLLMSDPGLRGELLKQVQINIAEMMERLKERDKPWWEHARQMIEQSLKEHGYIASACSRAGDGCSGGCGVCCAVAAGCDFLEWLGEGTVY
jgi:hypothetical protein